MGASAVLAELLSADVLIEEAPALAFFVTDLAFIVVSLVASTVAKDIYTDLVELTSTTVLVCEVEPFFGPMYLYPRNSTESHEACQKAAPVANYFSGHFLSGAAQTASKDTVVKSRHIFFIINAVLLVVFLVLSLARKLRCREWSERSKDVAAAVEAFGLEIVEVCLINNYLVDLRNDFLVQPVIPMELWIALAACLVMAIPYFACVVWYTCCVGPCLARMCFYGLDSCLVQPLGIELNDGAFYGISLGSMFIAYVPVLMPMIAITVLVVLPGSGYLVMSCRFYFSADNPSTEWSVENIEQIMGFLQTLGVTETAVACIKVVVERGLQRYAVKRCTRHRVRREAATHDEVHHSTDAGVDFSKLVTISAPPQQTIVGRLSL